MNVLELASKRVILKKVASTHGGEWQGPCPDCGGNDRFHVWPDQNNGKGAYWCRSCGRTGDNIQFLRDFEGMSFRNACAELNISLPSRRDLGGAPSQPRTKPEFKPVSHACPGDLWQEKAEKFISWSQACLERNREAIAWLSGRGISQETAKDFQLGWNPGEDGKDIFRARKGWGLEEATRDDGRPKALWIPRGLVIPYIIDGIIYRIRIRRPEGEPRYYVLPGSAMPPMILGRERRAFVVVEAELDAIAIVACNATAGSLAMGSVSAKPDAEAFALLEGALEILNALDYDAAGARAMEWWSEQFERCSRWPVPQGKDPGEAYRLGIDLDKWIQAGLPPALTMSWSVPAGDAAGKKESATRTAPDDRKRDEFELPPDLPRGILELRNLLRNNPGVKIINIEDRLAVLRNGKYVGGRINELVFRDPEVTGYIVAHPADEIDGSNLV